MANVPEYTPQMQLEGPVRSEESIDVNPAAFGAGIARAGEQLGGEVSQGAFKIIDRDNYIKVERARQTFTASVDAKSQDLMMRKGEQAEGTPAELNSFMTQQRQQAIDGMTGRQQNLFDIDTLRYGRFAQNGMDRWAREQHTVAIQTTAARGAAGAAIGMRMANSSEQFDYQMGQLDKYNTDYTSSVGMSPDAAQEYKFAKKSDALMGVVNTLQAANKPDEAAKVLDTYKDSIDPAAHGYGALQKRLNKESTLLQSQATASTIYDKYHGENSNTDWKSAFTEASAVKGEVGKQTVVRLQEYHRQENEIRQVQDSGGMDNFQTQTDAYLQDQKRPLADRKGVQDPRTFTVAQMRDNQYPQSLIDSIQKSQVTETNKQPGLGQYQTQLGAYIADQKLPQDEQKGVPDPREFSIEQMRKEGYPQSLIEQLQKEQVKEVGKEGRAASAIPLSDSISDKIGALNSHAPLEQFNADRVSILQDLSALHRDDPYLAGKLTSELNARVLESKKLDPGVAQWLNDPKTGVRTRLDQALKITGSTGRIIPGNQNMIATRSEIYDYLVNTAKAHPDWDATKMEEFAGHDPNVMKIMVDGAMAKWKVKLGATTTGPSKPFPGIMVGEK